MKAGEARPRNSNRKAGKSGRVLLLTGFEPFGSFRINSSWEAIRDLDGARWGSWTLRARRLPVSYRNAWPTLRRALRECRPRAIVGFGLHDGREFLVERLAVNLNGSDPDNEGRPGGDRPIEKGAPPVVETRLPWKKLLLTLRKARIPARLSHYAGTYLCNHVFYRIVRLPRLAFAGFVHVPPLQTSSCPLGTTLPVLRKGVRAILRALLATR